MFGFWLFGAAARITLLYAHGLRGTALRPGNKDREWRIEIDGQRHKGWRASFYVTDGKSRQPMSLLHLPTPHVSEAGSSWGSLGRPRSRVASPLTQHLPSLGCGHQGQRRLPTGATHRCRTSRMT